MNFFVTRRLNYISSSIIAKIYFITILHIRIKWD
jgi:hypothetical protein